MKETLRNRIAFFSDETDWKRGSGSLSTREILHPRLLHASWFQPATHTERRIEHSHDVYHICIVEEGHGSMFLKSQPLPTMPGSLILISPGESHAFEISPNEDEIYSEVTFEIINDRNRPAIFPISTLISDWTGVPCEHWKAGATVTRAQHRRISDAISEVVRACVEPTLDRVFQVNRSLLRVLELIAGYLGSVRVEKIDPLQIAAHQLERDLQSDLSIQALAAQASMSTNHFIRSFHARFGLTPRSFHHQAKISAARKLLTQTRYPIKLIAEWTGFSDVYYFSRLFTQKTGHSPAAYRKTHRLSDLH